MRRAGRAQGGIRCGRSTMTVVGEYELIRKIGEGGYGKIFIARRVSGNGPASEVVLKQVKLPTRKQDREMCLREVSIMKGVHHPCILECKESFVHGSNIFIVMPHCTGGDLYSLLARQRKKKRRLPEEVVIDWFAQIVLGVEHMHSHNTLHRDLKSQNIFLRRDHLAPGDRGGGGRSRVALGDFGIAKELQFNKVAAQTFIGTPIFMSPEMLRKVPYGHKADVWAMGCVLYEMMALSEPFRAKTMEGLMRQVQHGQPHELPNAYSDELKDMCMRMLSKDPNVRPSAAELIRDSAALRAACASALSDAGATAASAAAAEPYRAAHMSMVSAFDAAAMAKHRGAQMNLPAAASEDEHAERSRATAAKQAKRCGIHIAFGYREEPTQERHDPGGSDVGNALLPPRPAVRKLEAIVPKPSVPSSVSPPAPAVQKEASSEWMVKAPGGALKPAHLSPPGVRGEVPDRRVRGPSVVKSPGEAKSTPPSAPKAQVALPAVAVKSPRPANAEKAAAQMAVPARPRPVRPAGARRAADEARARREAAEERAERMMLKQEERERERRQLEQQHRERVKRLERAYAPRGSSPNRDRPVFRAPPAPPPVLARVPKPLRGGWGRDARFEAHRGAPLRFQQELRAAVGAGGRHHDAQPKFADDRADRQRVIAELAEERARRAKESAKREREAELARLRAEVAALPSIKDPAAVKRAAASERGGARRFGDDLRNKPGNKLGKNRVGHLRLDPVAEHRFDYRHAREVNGHADVLLPLVGKRR